MGNLSLFPVHVVENLKHFPSTCSGAFSHNFPRICTILLLIKTTLEAKQEKDMYKKNSVFYINVSCDLFANSIHVALGLQFEFSGWREEGRWTGTKQGLPKERHSKCTPDHFILGVVWIRRPTNCVGACAIAGLNITRRGQQL